VSTKTLPAILGGDPVVATGDQPAWPSAGAIESAALGEITEHEQWVGFGHKPAKWRAIAEQVMSDTMGYRYGVGQANGTLGIASGLRAQLLARGEGWARDRDRVLVADLTHASAHHGVLMGVAAQLHRVPTLVPIDARPDATMDEVATEAYLAQHADRVLAIVPATMYGNFGAIDRFVALAHEYDVIIHHDNALGGAARFDGPRALTASVSGQGEGKATPSCEGGLTVTSEPEIAWWVRADTDCGNGAGRLDPIPFADLETIPAGNQRMGEQPAAIMLMQWLRALHARLQARENRRLVQELITDVGLFDTPILWNPPMDAEYPPFFTLYMLCTDALEDELGVTPRDIRATFCAEGICAERGFKPTHQDPAWKHWTDGLDLSYAGSTRVHDRAVIMHTKYLRDPRLYSWISEILERVVEHKDALRGIGADLPESIC
jgi:dTDP-4-amino-4,6-dideoxygalactose transaminase